jgi:hypothetical protein
VEGCQSASGSSSGAVCVSGRGVDLPHSADGSASSGTASGPAFSGPSGSGSASEAVSSEAARARGRPSCRLGDCQVRLREKARVRVGRDGDRGVAERLLDVFQVGSGRVGRRCRAVAKIVELDRRRADLLVQLDEPPCDVILSSLRCSPSRRPQWCGPSSFSTTSKSRPAKDEECSALPTDPGW